MGKRRLNPGLNARVIILSALLCLLPAFNIQAMAFPPSADREQDLHLLEKRLEQARRSQSRAVIGTLLNNLGNAHAVEGNYDRAAGFFEEGLEICGGGSGTPEDRELAFLTPAIRINLAMVRYRNNDTDGTIQIIMRAGEEIEKLPDSAETARLLISLAVTAREIDNPPLESLSFLRGVVWHALKRAEGIGKTGSSSRLLSLALGYLGQLYEGEGRYSEALTLSRRALFHAQEGGDSDILYLWQWQLGRIFIKLNRYDAALTAYRDAVSTLTRVRRVLVEGRMRREAFFSSRIRPVYAGLARLLLRDGASGADETGKHERLIEARDTMEMLKNYELEDFFCDECVTASRSGMVKLDRAYPGTAILNPLLIEDSLVLLLTLPSGMIKVHVPLEEGGKLLSLSVKRFRERLQDPSGNRYLYYSKRLYRLLIAPIEEELRNRRVKTLIICPDSVFCMIPFAALHDGKQFLVEKYGIGVIPGMTLMKPAPFPLKNANVLLAGLSRTTGDKNVLPFVSRELNEIKGIIGGRIIRDRGFTLENLTGAFKQTDYAVVHMATHGFFGGKPGQTALQTYDGRLTMDRLNRLLSVGRFRKRPVELLSLSACQTALGDERAALGLGGIALKAGVRSAVATLWSVSDRAATTVMTEFYRSLSRENVSKAEALQSAQKKILLNGEFRHPAYWAPFLLIGNWM
ncbi:MAG: CHAT domain-containing protein [Desulfobacteraceae bacterium]|nr:CHAT domain-containing protein [Desulfobacteraceae bacterium]